MAMSSGTFHPMAPTSDPARPERERYAGPITFSDRDFSDAEDVLPWWRSITLFGALLLVAAIFLWTAFPSPTSGYGARLPATVVALGALLIVGGLAAAILSFGEEALAFFGVAAISFAVAFAVPIGVANRGFGASVPGFAILEGVIGVAVLSLVVGVWGLVRTYRALRDDE